MRLSGEEVWGPGGWGGGGGGSCLDLLTPPLFFACFLSMTGDKCQNCSLWSDVMEDDERAAKEIQKKANEEALNKGKHITYMGGWREK